MPQGATLSLALGACLVDTPLLALRLLHPGTFLGVPNRERQVPRKPALFKEETGAGPCRGRPGSRFQSPAGLLLQLHQGPSPCPAMLGTCRRAAGAPTHQARWPTEAAGLTEKQVMTQF